MSINFVKIVNLEAPPAVETGRDNRKLTNRGGTGTWPTTVPASVHATAPVCVSVPAPASAPRRYTHNELETIFYCLFGLG